MHGNNVLARVNAVREDTLVKLEAQRVLSVSTEAWYEVQFRGKGASDWTSLTNDRLTLDGAHSRMARHVKSMGDGTDYRIVRRLLTTEVIYA